MFGQVTFGGTIARTAELIRGDARKAAVWFALLVALSTIVDRLNPSGTGSNVGQGAASIFAQYSIVSGLLAELGLMPDGYRTRPFWGMLGVSLLTTFGILLGSVLLIVPGVFLAVRWSLAVPALIGEEPGVFGAMRASWRATQGIFWPILGVLTVIYLPVVVVLVGVGAAMVLTGAAQGTEDGIGLSLVVNVVVYGAMVAGWYASVAIYERASDGAGRLRALGETFA